MKKWICKNEHCTGRCVIENVNEWTIPHICPYISSCDPQWVEMDGTEPVTESNQLPKLTAEVFDREDCPEWCKVGEYGYAYDSGYFKIIEIIDGGKNLKVEWVKEGVQGIVFGCNIKCKKQARLRPYTADEMRGLVGKVIVEKKSGDIGLVIGYCNRKESVYAGRNDFVAAVLLSDYTIDGKPCGVLEHLEDGEWVE